MGPPEICLFDNGKEFKNTLVVPYLEALGVDVRFITPGHPASNGRSERFNRTIKSIITKLVNAKAALWEECLGPALYAYRLTTSSVTQYSPFLLQYGRVPTCPRQRLWIPNLGQDLPDLVAQRMDELSEAFADAARSTMDSRLYNRERLRREANARPLKLGDCVMVLGRKTGSFEPQWDHGFVVTRIRGTNITVIGPRNKKLKVHREKVTLAEPDSNWDQLNPRLSRKKRKLLYAYVPPPPAATGDGKPGIEVPDGVGDLGPPASPPPPETVSRKRRRVGDVGGEDDIDPTYIPPGGAKLPVTMGLPGVGPLLGVPPETQESRAIKRVNIEDQSGIPTKALKHPMVLRERGQPPSYDESCSMDIGSIVPANNIRTKRVQCRLQRAYVHDIGMLLNKL